MRSGFVLIAAVLVLGAPSVARADDASLFNSYVAQQPATDAASAAYIKAAKRSARRGATRGDYRRVIRKDRAINRVLKGIRAALQTEAPSTPGGDEAKRHALDEVNGWMRGNRFEMRALQAAIDSRFKRSDRLYEQANRTMLKETFPAGRRAVKAFKALGLESPAGGITGKPPA